MPRPGPPPSSVTAPTPVDTQQPMRAATAGSTPSGRAIAAASGTTAAAAIVPIPQYDRTGSPSRGREDRGAVGHPVAERGRIRTGPRPAGAARPADAARDEPRQRDRLADAQARHARPDRLDDAGALVAHDDRRRARPLAVAHVQVRVADARGEHPHADLAGTRLGDDEVLDRRWVRRRSGARPRERGASPRASPLAQRGDAPPDGRARTGRSRATTSRRR